MAKRNVTSKDNSRSLDQNAYRVDESLNKTYRAVYDEDANEKLSIIADALGDGTSIDQQYRYNEINSVTKDLETVLLTFTAPSGVSTYLQRIDVSGSNIAEYKIKIDNVIIDKKRTMHGNGLNEYFIFDGKSNNGYPLTSGQIVTVTVIHSRPQTGDFNSKLQVIQV